MDNDISNTDERTRNNELSALSRICVLIPGMHRSGTSALSRVLNILGCGLPDDLVGAGIGNETGHWEPRSLVLFNDDLLASAGSRWDDWQKVNPNWYKSASYTQYKERARNLINREFQDQSLFVMKDPRIPQIMPFWLDVLKAENIEIKIVIPIRDPYEVAASLDARDMMEPTYAKLLWLRRVLDMEYNSRNFSRLFTGYDKLLQDWRSVIADIETSLDMYFPRRSALVDQEIDMFLKSDLRHQTADRRHTSKGDGISLWLQETYAILSGWSAHGEQAQDFPKLNDIREAFDKASGPFASLILPGSRSGEPGEGGRQLNALRAQVENLEQDLAAAKNDLGQAASNHISMDQYESTVNELQSALEDVHAKAEERNRIDAEYHQLQEQLAFTENILRQREEEIEQTRTELAAHKHMGDEVDALRRKLTVSEAWVFKLAEQRQAAEKAAQEYLRQRDASQRMVEANEKNVGRLKQLLDIADRKIFAVKSELEAELSVSQVEIARLTEVLMQKENSMSVIKKEIESVSSKLKTSHRDIAKVTRMLIDSEERLEHSENDKIWFQELSNILSHYPSWWRFLSEENRQRRIDRRLMKKGLFDGQAYLEHYQDVADSGMNPLQHYLLHGMAEGRNRFSKK